MDPSTKRLELRVIKVPMRLEVHYRNMLLGKPGPLNVEGKLTLFARGNQRTFLSFIPHLSLF